VSFTAYPDYEDCGLPWLDRLPSHWSASHLRWLSRRYSGGTPDKRNLDFWIDGTIPWLGSGEVNQRTVFQPTTYITEDAFAQSSAKWVPRGALVMALAGQGKTKGMVAQMGIDATCNQSMAAIVPNDPRYSRYLFWWLDANYQNIRNMAGGDLRDGLNLELLGDIGCPLPPVVEQNGISAFLDRETAKIDALVAEQERLIALLKEKRQAVISHAVTKGLNPHAPMKNSGIEWLDEIPAHWDVRTVGYLCEKISYGFTNPMPTADDGPFMLTANDIGDRRIRYETARRTDVGAFTDLLTDKSRPQRGDILLTKDGTLGRVAVFDGKSACINQSVASLRPAKGISSEFLAHALADGVYQTRMIYEAGGTTIKHIYISRLAKMPMATPPCDEIDELVAFCNGQQQIAANLVSSAQAAITLLQERRAALISAAVTGKIDVRGLVDKHELEAV